MKKRTVVLLSLAAALASTGALGADLPSRKAPPPPILPPPAFTWTGFYGGVNIGGGFLDRQRRSNYYWNGVVNNWGWGGDAWDRAGAGVVGGGQVGYNWQISSIVLGVEADIQGTSIGSNGDNGLFPLFSRRIDWFGTVRGRAGVALMGGPLLIYGTGGFAYGGVSRPFFGGFLFAPGVFDYGFNNGWRSTIDTGWTAGGGVEYSFTRHWSGKIEYLYTELNRNNDNRVFFFDEARWRTRFHTIRAGLNYRFNFGGPAPVVASF